MPEKDFKPTGTEGLQQSPTWTLWHLTSTEVKAWDKICSSLVKLTWHNFLSQQNKF